MAEINVPVKLLIQNLLSLINELQNKLSNLKVGSTGFKAIQNTIAAIRGEIDKLSIQTGKPFIDASQFSKAERSVEKLEEDIDKVGLVMSRLKFSDLELTSELKADIKAFEDQLNSIKDKLRTIKSTAKDEFLKSAMGQEWLKIDETAFSKSLSQITNNIRKAVADLNTELNKLELTALSYLKALSENERIKEFISKNKGDPLSEANLGDMYDKIFMTTTKGLFRYTNNGRNLLADWLELLLHLDDSVIALIINKNVSAANVGEKLKEVLQNLMQSNLSLVDNNPNVTAKVEEAKTKYNELIAILKLVGLSELEVTNAELVLRAAFTATTGNFDAYRDKLVEIARGNTDVLNTTGMMKSLLDSLRTTLELTNGQFLRMQRTLQSFNLMKMAVVNFMGFNQVLNLTKRAIREAVNHIKELDTVMNGISIVTDMSTADLWNLVDAYSKMALTYGTTIKGAYEVSLIYYQLGLQTNDVLTLTNETLKLAKVSGLDYALTTDYMTTALRGFKMEMSEASTVVDVYSNLAAHTAVTLEELAVAMSKTASSMESVGSTFEEASAMIGTMVAVTRESATNIGSALKSIASRYGEMKSDPSILLDAEGEAIAYNKVDAALQSVGISLKTTDGLFRSFTDVILELSEVWGLLESTLQRYIATLFAGNRQQSRFLALVSNPELLKANLNYAEESEDTGTLLALKALDSIESKLNLVLVAYLQFYTTLGVEGVWKNLLDGTKNVINTLNSLPKLFGKIPVGAVAAITSIITLIKNLGVDLITSFADIFKNSFLQGTNAAEGEAANSANTLVRVFLDTLRNKKSEAAQAGKEVAESATQAMLQESNKPTSLQLIGARKAQASVDYITGRVNLDNFNISNGTVLGALTAARLEGKITNEEYELLTVNLDGVVERTRAFILAKQLEASILNLSNNTISLSISKIKSYIVEHKNLGVGLLSFGSALNMIAMTINTTAEGGKTLSGSLLTIAGMATIAGIAIKALLASLAGTEFAVPWLALVSGAMMLINGFSTLWVTAEERLEELENKAEELNNLAKEAKANYRTLDNSIKKINELKEKRYESAEAAEEYLQAVDDLTDKFPALIGGFTSTGEIIINTINAEEALKNAREASAKATFDAATAELKAATDKKNRAEKLVRSHKQELFMGTSSYDILYNSIEDDDQFYNWVAKLVDTFEKAANTDNILKKIDSYAGDLTVTLSSLSSLLLPNVGEILESDGSIKTLKQVYEFLYLNFNALNEEELNFYNELNQVFSINSLDNKNSELLILARGLVEKYNNAETAQELILAYNELNKFLSTSFDDSSEEFKNVAKELSKQLGISQISSYIDEYLTLLSVESALKESAVLGAMKASNSITLQYKFMADSESELGRIAAENLLKILPNVNQLLENISTEDFSPVLLPIEKFYESVIGEDSLKLLNKMLTDMDHYSAEDIWKQFGSKDTGVPEWLTIAYSSTIEYALELLNEALNHYKLVISEDTNLEKVDTTVELNYFSSIIKLYDNYMSHGLTDIANKYWEESLTLFTSIEEILDVLTRNNVLDTLLKNGFATKEAIESSINSLNDINGIDSVLTKLLLLATISLTNIPLAISSTLSEFTNDWKDNNEALVKLISGGIEGNEVDEIIKDAEKYNVDLSSDNNWEREGTKYLLTVEKWKEYRDAKNVELNTAMHDWLNNLNQILLMMTGSLDFTAEALYEFGIDPSKYFNDEIFDSSLFKQDVEAMQLLESNISNAWNTFYQLLHLRIRQEAELTLTLLKSGDYTSIEKSLSLKGKETIERLKELALFENYTDDELKDKNIKEVVNGILETYNSLISDLLSKGYENIDWDSYDYISEDNLKIDFTSYQNLIKEYTKYAKLSIDETNDLILQAVEKDNETKSEDLIKDLTFLNENNFRGSRTALTKIANAFDKPIEELILASGAVFDQTTLEYIVDIQKLSDYGIDLKSVDNFKITVQESIDALFSSLSSDISNALKGSLDVKGSKNLTDNLRRLNLDANLAFTRTKNGLQLSVAETVKLYNELNKVNSLAAQIVLDELNTSIEDSITGMKELKGEMREIAELRATTESDDFKFMSKNIPSGLNNPLNYWGDMYKGVNTLINAAKTPGIDRGKIGYQDFYNIITEFGHLADQTGELKISGNTVLHNSLEAADLIEAGARALTVASDGSIKVDLSKIGIDFAAGADAMTASVDAGIDKVAQAQIDMLDSMIQVLETIVAMEALGDITGENAIIDFDDLFEWKFEGGLKTVAGFTQGYQNFIDYIKEHTDKNDLAKYNKDLADGLENTTIQVDGFEQAFTFAEMVGMTPEELALHSADGLGDAYATVLLAWKNAADSGNYNLNNIMASIKEVLAGSGFLGDITVGDMRLTIHNGIILERDSNNNFIVDGISYSKKEDALAATMLSNLGIKPGKTGYTVTEDGLQGILTIGSNNITVISDGEKTKFTSEDGTIEANSLDDFIEQLFKMNNPQLTDTETGYYTALERFKIEQGYTVVPTLDNIEAIHLTSELKSNILSKTAEDLNKEWLAAGENTADFKLTYGISLEGSNSITPEELELIKELNNLESKTTQLKIEFELSEEDQALFDWLNELTKTLTIKINTEKGEIQEANILDKITSGGTLEALTLDIEAIITNYTNAPNVNPLNLVKDLTAIATKYKNEIPEELLTPITGLIGIINSYDDSNIDGTALLMPALMALKAFIGSYDEGADPEVVLTAINNLIGSIVQYNEKGTPNVDLKTIDALTAWIKEYSPREGVEPPTLDDLTLYINSLNTEGVDSELAAWRTKQEAIPISITPLLVGTHKEGDVVYLDYTLPESDGFDPFAESDKEYDVTINYNSDTTEAELIVEEFKKEVSEELIMPVTTDLDSTEADTYDPPEKVLKIYLQLVFSGGSSGNSFIRDESWMQPFVRPNRAKGNIALSKGTLMGELGPELVVSNGRYFVAGLNGPEMVNLADDAIVFNHLQTKSLLEKGMSSGRGKAVTNERNAVSFATGNVNGGPAMASASAALAALKQLRAQWQALAGLSAKDLAGKGGGGGGGGGDPKAFVKELEKWYNWLLQIALLEKEITLEESKRLKYLSSMIAMGREYAASLLDTLKKLKEQAAVQLSLNNSLRPYFEKRRKELNENSAFKALYEFDENGLLKYKPGKLEQLSDLVGRNEVTGKANYTAKELYEKLVEMGYAEQMMYDSSGNEIKLEGDDWYNNAVQAFWEKIEAEREEMQSLHDDVLDGDNKIYELLAEQNQILHEIEDNLIAVEEKVLKAVEDVRQRAIDAALDEKDAIEKSSQALLDGLSTLLLKERDMLQNQENANELSRLLRQLAILQRSGGSASQIASLLKDITSKQQDAYFDALQQLIDALLEASDNLLEKLQEQIDLMTELLNYEKENGLLWLDVYKVMSESPEYITSFIMENTKEYFGKSPTELTKETRNTLVEAEKFVEYRELVTGGLQELINLNSDEAISELSEEITAEAETAEETPATDTDVTDIKAPTDTTTTSSSEISGYYYKSAGADGHYLIAMLADGSLLLKGGLEPHTFSGNRCTKCYYEKKSGYGNGSSNNSRGNNANIALAQHLASGGLITRPTHALIGETGKPEAVLNPEQTAILRNEILSNKPTSLLSLLTDFRDAYNSIPGASSYSSIGASNSVIIEQATVEMNVAEIANDYDARRAGEKALEKMLSIARKTLSNNRIGR